MTRRANLTPSQKAAVRHRAETGRMFLVEEELEEEVPEQPRPGPGRRRPPATEIPPGTPIRRLPPGGAEGATPFDWPNPAMTAVANTGPRSNRSLKSDVERLVRQAEAQGCRIKSGRHWKLLCPGGIVIVSKTPSDPNVLRYIRSDLRRAGVVIPNPRQPNRATRKLKRPKLADARRLAQKHPRTFELPSKDAVADLDVGDFAKVAADGERFWVQVTKRDGSKFQGVVDNDLIATERHGLQIGDRVAFESRHLYDAVSAERMARAMADRLAANPLNPSAQPRRRSDEIRQLDARLRRLKDHLDSIEDILERGGPSDTERRGFEDDVRRIKKDIAAINDRMDAIERTIELEGDLVEPPAPSLWGSRVRNPFVGRLDSEPVGELEQYAPGHLAGLPTLRRGHEADLKVDTPTHRWWLDRVGSRRGATHRITVEEFDPDDRRWWPVHRYAPY